MRIIVAGMTVMLLGGCNTLINQLPSVQNCYEVHYNRIGIDVDMNLKCHLPVTGGNLHLSPF